MVDDFREEFSENEEDGSCITHSPEADRISSVLETETETKRKHRCKSSEDREHRPMSGRAIALNSEFVGSSLKARKVAKIDLLVEELKKNLKPTGYAEQSEAKYNGRSRLSTANVVGSTNPTGFMGKNTQGDIPSLEVVSNLQTDFTENDKEITCRESSDSVTFPNENTIDGHNRKRHLESLDEEESKKMKKGDFEVGLLFSLGFLYTT